MHGSVPSTHSPLGKKSKKVKKKAHFSMAGSVQVLNRLLEQALREGRKAGTSQVCIFLGLKAINVHLTHGFDLFSSNHLMLK